MQSNSGLNALCNCLGEICSYLGEDPLEFLNKNTFYFNRKYENRKKFFLNISIDKIVHQSETILANKVSDIQFNQAVEEIKNALKENNIITQILKEISNKEFVFGKDNLYKLIIPLKERLYVNDYNIEELYNFHLKHLERRDKDELIKIFMDKLLNPKKFKNFSRKLFKHSEIYFSFLSKFFNIVSKINPDTRDSSSERIRDVHDSYCKIAIPMFIRKYYIEKMKNKFNSGNEKLNENKQEEIIC